MTSTRAAILQALRQSREPLTIAQVARHTGVHANTVRFHLDSLLDSGQVEQVTTPPSGRGRPAIRVRAVAAMDRGGPRSYELLAEALLLDITTRRKPAEHARRAGRAWGARIADHQERGEGDPVIGLMDALDGLNFAPQQTASDEITLRHCPFLDLTTPEGGLVCAIHLGLMQGVLDGSGVEVDRLDPFVEPDQCCAHLASATG